MKKIEAVDLFCGIGGLTYGLKQVGIEVLAGLDFDDSCKYAFEKNNESVFIKADIAKYDFNKIKQLYSKNSYRVLVGCAPCQPFSAHAHKKRDKEKDTRWNLIECFIEAVKCVDPHVISMENVRGLTKTGVFKKFLKTLEKLGYQISYQVVNCPDYGIPQNRSRLVLLGSKGGKISIPKKTHSKQEYVTVRDVIGKLPNIKNGKTSNSDSMHKSRSLAPINLKRIQQSTPKGTWREWDEDLLPNCYKRESGQTYTSVYGRMGWDNVSPTITTQFNNYGSGRFGHPEQDRALSLREGALLQTFPLDYDFGKDVYFTITGRHIGNAVPPKLGYVIGKEIVEHLRDSA